MQCRIVDMKCKEVINTCTGERLGFVEDVEVDTCSGQLVSIIIPGPCRVLGLFGRDDDFVIPWSCITRIGPDIILVNFKEGSCRVKRDRRSIF